jgi:hypothetical protein
MNNKYCKGHLKCWDPKETLAENGDISKKGIQRRV